MGLEALLGADAEGGVADAVPEALCGWRMTSSVIRGEARIAEARLTPSRRGESRHEQGSSRADARETAVPGRCPAACVPVSGTLEAPWRVRRVSCRGGAETPA